MAKSGRPDVAFLAEARTVFETKMFGVIAVTQAMLPLLSEAPAARIVNVSSFLRLADNERGPDSCSL